MNLYFSVVSHGHKQMIADSGLCELEFPRNVYIVIKDNLGEEGFENFSNDRIFLINEKPGMGFGANNNHIFHYCKRYLGMGSADYFICLNPDVVLNSDFIQSIISNLLINRPFIFTIRLYKDDALTVIDPAVRRFPSFKDFFVSFVTGDNPTAIKSECLKGVTDKVWAAGSFLGFRAELYDTLGGFDEEFFMYCEDVDICMRAYEKGVRLKVFDNIKLVHRAAQRNKKILSKHFVWHLMSILRYLWKRKLLFSDRK